MSVEEDTNSDGTVHQTVQEADEDAAPPTEDAAPAARPTDEAPAEQPTEDAAP